MFPTLTSRYERTACLPGGDQVAANEDLYNLGSRGIEYSLLPWQRKQGIPLIAYTPVAAGDERGQLINNPAVKEVAEAHQATPWQILLAWAIRDGSTLAIHNPATLSMQLTT